MEKSGRGDRAAEFPNDISGEGRPVELPGGGMPGPSGDEDGNVGALPVPTCYRHRGSSRRGKPPQPTVRPMQHAGTPAGHEQQSPCHSPVCQESRAEEAAKTWFLTPRMERDLDSF